MRKEVTKHPEVFFLLVCIVANSAIIGLTAVETRFGMIPLGALAYFALRFFIYDWRTLLPRHQLASGVLIVGYMVASAAASLWFVRGLDRFEIVWLMAPR